MVWATTKELSSYCYEPTLRIVEYVKSLKIPVICFKRHRKNYEEFCSIVKPDCISIDNEVDPNGLRPNVTI